MNVILSQAIEGQPGIIVGPISTVLGWVINVIFNLISFVTPVGVLGISIIVMTFLFRLITLPTGIRQYRSNLKMKKLQPEIQKIRDKYGDTKDPELKRKMNAEIQTLYSKSGVNMFASCLPMLLTMPIFIAMIFVMRQGYLFIGSIGDIYEQLARAIMSLDNFVDVVRPLALVSGRVPENMRPFDIGEVENMMRLINVFRADDWAHIFANMQGSSAQEVLRLHGVMESTISFLGVNLIANSGMTFPGVVIPVLTVITSFFQTRSMMTHGASPSNGDPNAQRSQKMMMYIMPLVMGFFTVSFSAGVGIYWIAGNIYAIVQQYLIHRHFTRNKDENDENGKDIKTVKSAKNGK
ncbi:MAG: YidC/Oxa1 family membrane protein insertase [Defluviitaleaceae bacterium]|nr:YidC/Oxa1 family membrane protein insertase [Defluviitaleaceae bacterium]